jgi:hypothetical protein
MAAPVLEAGLSGAPKPRSARTWRACAYAVRARMIRLKRRWGLCADVDEGRQDGTLTYACCGTESMRAFKGGLSAETLEYTDDSTEPVPTLRSNPYGLVGRPDLLVRLRTPLVPVQQKAQSASALPVTHTSGRGTVSPDTGDLRCSASLWHGRPRRRLAPRRLLTSSNGAC